MTGIAAVKNPLLVVLSTTRYLLLVELNSKMVIPIENTRPEYYGISWFCGSSELVLSHSGINNADLVDIATYALSETGFVSQGSTVTSPFLSAPHQILCAEDGRVICTNTGRNSVSIIDMNKPNLFQEARISPARWDRLSLDKITGDHLNSVFLKGGFLYVIAHGHARGSTLATLSYPELSIVALEPVTRCSGLHNIWITNEGQKITCHSEAGALLDIDTGEILWESGSPIYTRGLAASSEIVLVGESQKTGRDLRTASMSALWLLDRQTWQPLDYILLGPYGAVHEIRLVNFVDEAHHGHVFEGVAGLLARDLRRSAAEERIRAARQARQIRSAWVGYKLVYGTPSSVEQYGRTAAPRQLCLVTQTHQIGQSSRELAFRYSLGSVPGESHVSPVTYCGKGGDTDMHALLLCPVSDTKAMLNVWTHDGKSWSVCSELGVDGLPLKAEARISVNGTHVELYLDGTIVLSVLLARMPFHGGALGIRWVGSTIYPAHDVIPQCRISG